MPHCRRRNPAVNPLSRHFARGQTGVGIQKENHSRRRAPFGDLGRQLMYVERAQAVLRQAPKERSS